MIGPKKKACVAGVSIVVLLAVVVALIIVFVVDNSEDGGGDAKNVGNFGVYGKAAVSTNGEECAQIGADILARDGSAVDAAIAALLCEGVASLHSMGLGGGFLMTIWDAKYKVADYLDARETAPRLAHKDMFNGNATLSMYGGLAVAVPGELRGYWEAHQKYGKLPWSDLFEPTITLCATGSRVNSYLAAYLSSKQSMIKAQDSLAEILINPDTNSTWKTSVRKPCFLPICLGGGTAFESTGDRITLYLDVTGTCRAKYYKKLHEDDRIRRPQLAKTLKLIARYGPDIFYNGLIGDSIVNEIKAFNGIIDKEDLRNYRVKWVKPIESKIGDLTIYSAPPPGSGVVLAFIMNVLRGFVPITDKDIMWQRIIETFKWAYARRTELGDPDYVSNIDAVVRNLTSVDYADTIRGMIKDNETSNDPKYYGASMIPPEDSGTSHVSVLAPDGSAVSVTSTINQVFGAMIRSKSTGIIFNDEMDDFSSPNIQNGFDLPISPANFIYPGKRPLSSMSPTIVLDDKKTVRLIIGGAGGSKITTGVAIGMVLNLWSGYNIKEAIDERRIHHQLFPMNVQNEDGVSADVLSYLRKVGHNVTTFSGIGSAITAIAKQYGKIFACSDFRRQGRTAGF